MASDLLNNLHNFSVSITRIRNIDCYYTYEMKVNIKNVNWRVLRSYNEFLELDHCLVVKYGFSSVNSLPKVPLVCNIIRFLEVMKEPTEKYIANVLEFFLHNIPKELVSFINLQLYDKWFMFNYLFANIYRLNWTENPPREYALSLIEVHAITERMKLLCPPLKMATESQKEFCAILEFCRVLPKLKINGFIEMTFRSSNIGREKLNFDLRNFKRLKHLILARLNVSNFVLADYQRKTLVQLDVYDCDITKLVDLLLCDHKPNICKDSDEVKMWPGLKRLEIQKNEIFDIESGLSFVPNVEYLDASYNKLRSVNLSNFQTLKCLRSLNLSRNSISIMVDCVIDMPLLEELILSFNQLKTLKPFRNLVRLRALHLEYNEILDLHEVAYISHLYFLENLGLFGNPLSAIPDYRVSVFFKLGNLADKIKLDQKMANQNEFELLSILKTINNVVS